ncbi:MAG: ribonuclease R [Nitrospirae bacterium]|nr:ribonuclease R [Nitrospirota bacterium]
MIPRDIENKEAVLNFLKTKTERPVSLKEISEATGFLKRENRTLKRILQSLVQSGDIFKTRYGLYGPVEKMNLVTGYFEAHRDGYGFVIPDKPGERDLFVPPRKTSAAMSGDRVIVRVESAAKREGSIIKILERAQKKVIGTFYREGDIFFVKPKNRKIPFGILISPGNRAGAKDGNNVVVELTSYPTAIKPPEGKVLKILSDVSEPVHEIDMIIEEHSLSRKFPSAVLAEVRELSGELTLRKRTDCRDILTVTIDGETAKDFDDAVSISKTDDGYALLVHIADVGHYVPWDSAVDLEARRRGTSVYFPGSVIPMLPEKLSNDLCSLVPKQDRPTFTVELHFDKGGEIIRKDFYPSVINSNERMTYTSVKKILVDKDREERARYGYLLASFELMEALCYILRDKRIKRGSLDFDLPEPEVLLDIQGRPEAIVRAERNLAHMMIEEFMIAANEAVASHLEKLELPSIYRVHEKPDPHKLEELKPIFNSFGLQIKRVDANTFQTVLKKIRGKVEEALLNVLLLRSLKQAKYSTDNTGHFGLASESYTHFTSPIRRYPDLVVHRILRDSLLKGNLSKERLGYLEKLLPEIAASSSKTERTADEAEREIVNAMRVWFMKDKVGEEYPGIVSNISSSGMRIQLKDFFVEGFLHVSSMPDDYYRFDEKSYRLTGRRRKKSFAVGKEVKVRVERVDIETREIVLGLV